MKRRIGVLFPSPKSGGVFQYALSIADSLISYSDKFRYSIVHYEDEKPELFLNRKKALPDYISIPKSRIASFRKILHFLNLLFGGDIFLVKNFYEAIKNANIDLLIIPTPFSFNPPLTVPYIVSIPDYMHKYYPNFPEYTFKSKMTRDMVYTYYAKHSVLVVADSEQGVDDLHKFSGIDGEKVRIIPYIPPSYIYKYRDMNEETAAKLLSNYQLPERFIFYPGQFWFQKNHARLIKSLHFIKKTYQLRIPLVLVGHSKENYEKTYKEITALIKGLDMSDQIIHLGYVREIEMVALYKKAVALVAPPFQGPTTLPPLEAMVLGVPVVTSNLFEVPKQVGEAGLLFDPLSIEDIAEKIYRVWQDEKLRQKMIERGSKRIKDMTQANYAKKWESVIEETLKIHERK